MFLFIKTIHIISSTLLFGTGLGSAFFMFMAYRSNDIEFMRKTNRLVVIVDFIFTTPAVIIQLASGLLLLSYLQIAWTTTWSLLVLSLYAAVGLFWIPVVFLQIALRDQANKLEKPNKDYHAKMKLWITLGSFAFPTVLVLFGLMVFKPYWS